MLRAWRACGATPRAAMHGAVRSPAAALHNRRANIGRKKSPAEAGLQIGESRWWSAGVSVDVFLCPFNGVTAGAQRRANARDEQETEQGSRNGDAHHLAPYQCCPRT